MEVFGLAMAKQILLPPGEAVYAPQSPYWASKVGCVSPAVGAAAAEEGAAGFGGGFGAAGLGAVGLTAAGRAGVGAGACCATAVAANAAASTTDEAPLAM